MRGKRSELDFQVESTFGRIWRWFRPGPVSKCRIVNRELESVWMLMCRCVQALCY